MQRGTNLQRRNLRVARNRWGIGRGHIALQILDMYSQEYRFSLSTGDLLFLNQNWYVTHAGLLRLSRRRHCRGIDVNAVPERSGSRSKAFACASDIAPDPPGPGRARPEPSEWRTHPLAGETRNSVSCCTFLAAKIAVELAEQRNAVFLGPVGQVSDKAFDLFPGGFAEGFGPAEIDGVGLDQVGIELVLADQLAEAVTDLGAAVVPIDRLGRDLLRRPRRRSRLGK